MGRLTPIIIVVLAATSWCSAQQAKRVPREVLDRIVDDEPNPLPRYLTPAERQLPLPAPSLRGLLRAAPTGTVNTPAEYERNQGLLIRWGSYNSVLTEMTVGITTGDPDAVVYILVTGASQQSSATSTLSSAGADLEQLEFITYSANTVWIRDYGPRFIFEDDVRAIVDHTYNRPRPADDAFPSYLGQLWDEEVFEIPLTHGGGNFHLFANDDAFMSDLILDENPSLTEQDVKDLYRDYLNVDLTIFPGFPTSFDSTQHIDMWMQPLADDKIIIGEYASSTGQPYQITENAVVELTSRGYTVYRTPGWQSAGTHYTYTNSVILNDLVLIPRFGGSFIGQDATALSVFEAALPDHDILQVYCGDIIHAAGAIHCIMMHVPAYTNPIPIVEVHTPNGGEYCTVGQPYDVTWTARDDVGVTGVDIYYSTDGGATYPHEIALGEADDGFFEWTVPDTPAMLCRVKIIARDADANSGEDVSDADFVITSEGPARVYDFPLDSDPGWTGEGQWEFGQPTGDGSQNGDPDSGYTGDNVYGYNLEGDYTNDLLATYLTTTALDLSLRVGTELRFRRWLGVESADFDHATVEVSNNGSDWEVVWDHIGGSISESSWSLQTYDISAVADGQPTVYLRWGMGPTDVYLTYPGWNIDDVEIWAIELSLDCNGNGIEDDEDISGGTSVDLNDNGIPDECEVYPPLPAPYPHNRAKNRYLSFDPNAQNAGVEVAFNVQLKSLELGSCSGNGAPCRLDRGDDDCRACSTTGYPCINAPIDCSPPGQSCELTGQTCVNDQAGSVGMTWWVGPASPGGSGVHLLVSAAYRKVSDAWPAVVHLADCEVVPRALYGVRTFNAVSAFESAELEVSTITKPDLYWADGVGDLGSFCTGDWTACPNGDSDCPSGESCVEQWSLPDGVTNFYDITAAVFAFQQTPGLTMPQVMWVDLHGDGNGQASTDPPNYMPNFADITLTVLAFKGRPYPYADPAECPDVGVWP